MIFKKGDLVLITNKKYPTMGIVLERSKTFKNGYRVYIGDTNSIEMIFYYNLNLMKQLQE
jgi:hypothetical protein